MILDIVQKINNSIQKNIESLISENIFSVKLLREVGLDKITEVLNKDFSIKEHFNLRVLNRFKDIENIDNLIQKDNFIAYKQILSLSPYLKDQALETFFEFDRTEKRTAINVNTTEKVVNLAHFSYGLKDDDFDAKIFNHFSGSIINTHIGGFGKQPSRKEEASHLLVDPEKVLERKGDLIHEMRISVYEVMEYSRKFNEIRDVIPADVTFEFVLNHEMAHASHPQIGSEDKNLNEKNSDLSSIIKMIKNHDLTQEEAQQLCNDVINFRTTYIDFVDHYSKFVDMRVHHTIDSVIALKTVLETELENIKQLDDKEICRYSAFIIEEQLKNGGLVFGQDNHVDKIDHEYINMLVEMFNEKLMFAGPMNSVNNTLRDFVIEFFPVIVEENKMIYEDILIQKMLAEDFQGNLTKLSENYSNSNPNLGHIVRNTFQVYQENKMDAKLNLKEKFDSKMLDKRVSIIKSIYD